MLEIGAYPRPRRDTALSFRLAGSSGWTGLDGATHWLEDLTRAGVSWSTVSCSPEAAPSEDLVRGLIGRGIEVIVEVDSYPIAPLDQDRLRRLCRELSLWGVRYVAVHRHANLASSWRMTDWAPLGLVERFGQGLIPSLETVALAGLIPLIGPLAPGGHYWDLAFLDRLLGYLASHARDVVLDRLGLCYQWATSNRPLSWGKGGPEAWPLARPYSCPTGSQDHQGFRIYEWYDQMVRARLGRSLPLLCVESGPSPTLDDHPDLPSLDEDGRRGQVVEVARLAANGGLPEYVFTAGAWPYTPGAANSLGALYALLDADQESAALRVLQQVVSHPRRPAEEPTPAPHPTPVVIAADPDALFDHYLLIRAPVDGDSPFGWSVQSALLGTLDYVRRCQPTIGFRLEEARRAAQVTLVGPSANLLDPIAAELRRDGRRVDVVIGSSPPELKRALERLFQEESGARSQEPRVWDSENSERQEAATQITVG